MEADLLDAAEMVLDQLEPLSDEEWLKMLAGAPVDDEPLTPEEITLLEAVAERRTARERWHTLPTG